jgi:amino acid transporter
VRRAGPAVQQKYFGFRVVAGAFRPHVKRALWRLHGNHPDAAAKHVGPSGIIEIIHSALQNQRLSHQRRAIVHNSRMSSPAPLPIDPAADAQFLAAEHDVELHSAELRKELSLSNLVFTQVLSILGLAWIGSAAKLGSSHLVFWLAAIFLFYIPSALVVIHLNREMPLEGGLYQWAKLRFSEMIGFLVAWNMLLYVIIFLSEMGLLVMNNIAYAAGPAGAWLAGSKAAITAANVIVTGLLILVARAGLSIGKWIHGFAGFMILFLFAAMALFAIPHWFHGMAVHPPLALSIPAFTFLNVNLLGRMGFGALGGFDTVAVFTGECHGKTAAEAAATVRRSVWIATPIIAGSFILGTACVLVFVKPADIDLISPITQVLNLGLHAAGLSGSATSLIGAFIILTLIGQAVLSFNYGARLPLVAGWDHLLPAWFTRLHPRHKTPVGSIAFIGITTLVIALLTSVGADNQEAFQLLQNANGIAFGLAYLVMFAIPLIAPGEKPSGLLRAASASGFAMTLLYMVMSLFPIIDVPNPFIFGLKIGGLVLGFNVAAALFYWRADVRRKRLTVENLSHLDRSVAG